MNFGPYTLTCYSAVKECVVMKDRASGKSRGFGFVTYWSAADAQRVLEGNHVVDGRRCEVRGRVS